MEGLGVQAVRPSEGEAMTYKIPHLDPEAKARLDAAARADDLAEIGIRVPCIEHEDDIARLLTGIKALESECERHRNANLLRAVIGGRAFEVDELVTDAINAENFDRVPWLAADKLGAENLSMAEQVKKLEAAILDIDAHATALGEDGRGFVAGGYIVTVGSLHRALGVVGHPAPRCLRCTPPSHDCPGETGHEEVIADDRVEVPRHIIECMLAMAEDDRLSAEVALREIAVALAAELAHIDGDVDV